MTFLSQQLILNYLVDDLYLDHISFLFFNPPLNAILELSHVHLYLFLHESIQHLASKLDLLCTLWERHPFLKCFLSYTILHIDVPYFWSCCCWLYSILYLWHCLELWLQIFPYLEACSFIIFSKLIDYSLQYLSFSEWFLSNHLVLCNVFNPLLQKELLLSLISS